jgi:cytochrome P450
MLLPAFHRERVAGYRDDIVSLTNGMFERWKPGEPLELHEEFLGLTARVVTTILFGGDSPGGSDEVARNRRPNESGSWSRRP